MVKFKLPFGGEIILVFKNVRMGGIRLFSIQLRCEDPDSIDNYVCVTAGSSSAPHLRYCRIWFSYSNPLETAPDPSWFIFASAGFFSFSDDDDASKHEKRAREEFLCSKKKLTIITFHLRNFSGTKTRNRIKELSRYQVCDLKCRHGGRSLNTDHAVFLFAWDNGH